MENFNELIDNLSKEIKNEVYGHSRFQIENFIIGSQPTEYGKYKQCILELRSRIKAYENFTKEIQKIEDIKIISQYEIYLEDIKREIYIINEIFEDIKNKIDLSQKEKLEEEYWNKKFEQELLSHWLIGAQIPVNLVNNIMCLPNDFEAKKKLLSFINVIQSKIEVIEDNGKNNK